MFSLWLTNKCLYSPFCQSTEIVEKVRLWVILKLDSKICLMQGKFYIKCFVRTSVRCVGEKGFSRFQFKKRDCECRVKLSIDGPKWICAFSRVHSRWLSLIYTGKERKCFSRCHVFIDVTASLAIVSVLDKLPSVNRPQQRYRLVEKCRRLG